MNVDVIIYKFHRVPRSQGKKENNEVEKRTYRTRSASRYKHWRTCIDNYSEVEGRPHRCGKGSRFSGMVDHRKSPCCVE